jgi:hypothetical protein
MKGTSSRKKPAATMIIPGIIQASQAEVSSSKHSPPKDPRELGQNFRTTSPIKIKNNPMAKQNRTMK